MPRAATLCSLTKTSVITTDAGIFPAQTVSMVQPKPFGNIVTFRDLERPTIDAITLFGDKSTRNQWVLAVKQGFTDAATGEAKRGFMAVVSELEQRFPDPASIDSEKEKKPSSNCLVNICGQKTSCKTTMNLPR